SSIRQIIADDDAAAPPRRPALQATPPMQAAPAKPLSDQADRDLSDMLDDIEPLALSPSQIVEESAEASGFSFDAILAATATEEASAKLVEAEDVSFGVDDELPSFDPLPSGELEPQAEPAPDFMALAESAQAEAEPAPAFEPEPVLAQAPPLPDPTLSS